MCTPEIISRPSSVSRSVAPPKPIDLKTAISYDESAENEKNALKC